MSGSLVLAVGALTSIGLYLITARVLSRIMLGFVLLGHAAVLALLAAGGPSGESPITNGDPTSAELISNPLPQALALTAIVISFGLTLFLLALTVRQQTLTGEDLVEDDLESVRLVDEARDPDHREHTS